MLVVLIFVKLLQVQGLIFGGSCPNIQGIQDFQCSQNLKATTYKVMAHLPVDNTTMNIFYSPYPSIDCLTYQMSCSYMSDTMVNVKLLCQPKLHNNVNIFYYYSYNARELMCLPNLLDMAVNPPDNQLQSFGLSLQVQCPKKFVNFKLSIMVSQKGFVILYGCRDINSGAQHDEGMWFLFPDSAVEENYNASFFDEALQMIAGSSATASDFEIARYAENVTCDCGGCDYMYDCPEYVDVEVTTESDYVQFTKPTRHKTTTTTYDYSYYEYPDYNYYGPENGTVNATESSYINVETPVAHLGLSTETSVIRMTTEVISVQNDTQLN